MVNKLKSLGVTPSSSSPSDISNGMGTACNNYYNAGVAAADARANSNSENWKNGYSNGYNAGKSAGTVTGIEGVGSANQTISTTAGELYICCGLGNNVNGNIAWSISGADSLWGTGGNSGGQQYRTNLVRATGSSMYVTCGNHVQSSVVRLVRG